MNTKHSTGALQQAVDALHDLRTNVGRLIAAAEPTHTDEQAWIYAVHKTFVSIEAIHDAITVASDSTE